MSEAVLLRDDEVDDEAENAKAEERRQILDALAMRVVKTRAEAIAGRANSGIEEEWLQDEEHYEGIDDANRHEHTGWRGKPFTAVDPVTRINERNGSTAFFNITRPYTDAAAARMGDMLLPTDDRAYSIRPTPIPETDQIAKGKIPDRINKMIEKDVRFARLAGAARASAINKTKADLVDSEKQILAAAVEKANKAQTQIEDWHVEGQFHAQVRQVIEDTCRVGTGVLKGPVPMRKKEVAYINGKLVVQTVTIPSSTRVDYWNCFPDPACGQSIHNGGFFWERDDITSKALQALKGGNYLDDEIDAVVKEGPHKATKEFAGDEHLPGLVKRETSTMFEIWYFHGRVKREDLEAAGCEFEDESDPKFDYDAILTMVNNRVIQATLNPLDTGEFPYDFMVWQRRAGVPWGMGVPRQMRTAQRVVNGAGRNMLDNAGLGGGPMWIYMGGIITPMDGKNELAPRKGWTVNDEASIEDVTKAFTFIEIPMYTKELTDIIMFGLKMAEDITGMPMLLQGQQGSAPDTVGGMKILNDNASSPMRRVARLFDDLITEPHIRRYYNYLLQYGDDDSMKGDFQIDARGSSALVERDLNSQFILQIANLVANPIYGFDPKKWAAELVKANRMAPDRLQYDDDNWQKVVEKLSQPQNPAVDVANINAQVKQLQIQNDAQQAEADREMEKAMKVLELQGQSQDHQMNIATKAIDQQQHDKEIGLKALDGQENRKVKLAEIVMKLKAQMELARQDHAGETTKPPTEPPGRAPNGESFEA